MADESNRRQDRTAGAEDEPRRVPSMHDDTETWHDTCCEPEPRWQAIAADDDD